jgi:hypothetical protein
MPKIKLNSISFGDVPFRKLKNITIPIADRITLISGHNGIGIGRGHGMQLVTWGFIEVQH